MKNNTDIDHIRILLHKYYEAETSPEEELLLESFFIDTPEDEIPDDLHEDRKLFLPLSSMHTDSVQQTAPDSLFNKLSEIVETSPDTSINLIRRKWKRRIIYSGIAAAGIALVTTGVLFRSSHNSTGKLNQPVGTLTEDGYIEITDTEEAERILREIGLLLASNSKKTDEAISLVSDTFDEYKEISKSVLK